MKALATTITIGPQRIQDPRKFFIMYKRDSAGDLARHIHEGLQSRGVDAFLDIEDVEEGLSTDEWRKQIDNTIDQTDVFIFIVTNGASSSIDIKRELQRARDRARENASKRILAFVDECIWDEEGEVMITLDTETIDIRNFQGRQFPARAPESLLREVTDSAQITRIIKPL
jgi:hypothetical protein